MCGNAEDEIFLAQNGLNVCAADNDAKKLTQVQLQPQAIKTGNIKVVCADILQPLPFAGHSFNSIYSIWVALFLQEPNPAIIAPELSDC